MTPTYIFILFVTVLSTTPNLGLVSVQAYGVTYPTRLACETAAPAAAANLVGKGRMYAFRCEQFQVGT